MDNDPQRLDALGVTKVLIVAEGPTDRGLLVALIRRVLKEESSTPADTIDFVGIDGRPYLQKSSLKNRIKKMGLRPVTSRSLSPEARVVKMLRLLEPKVSAIALLHDTDGAGAVHSNYLQALEAPEDAWAWLLATPHPEHEAWLIWIAGHDADVQKQGRDLKRAIGVDPVLHPHRLSSTPSSPKEAKMIAKKLALPDVGPSVERCPMAHLLDGDKTHLRHFILAIQNWARGLPA